MIKNSQGILICETCGEKIRTNLIGDRICPELQKVGHCLDLNLTYPKPEKSKFIRTGKETKNYDHK
jgi:hypothetical protein